MDGLCICFLYIILSSSAQAEDLRQEGVIGRYRSLTSAPAIAPEAASAASGAKRRRAERPFEAILASKGIGGAKA